MISKRKKLSYYSDIDYLMKKMQCEMEKVNGLIAEALQLTKTIHREKNGKHCTG